MKLENVLRDLNCEIVRRGGSDEITGVVIDSRRAVEGCLYVCIRGLRVDGHKFIEEAFLAGAAAVLVDREQSAYPEGMTVIKTDHCRKALCVAASNFYGRPADSLRISGVTGTNGKTSTTYFLETILSSAGFATGLIGTLGTRVADKIVDVPVETVTTPDTLELMQILARMKELGASDVVMEVSSHALSLFKVDGINFEVGIFTNLSRDHMDFHGTMENYRDAKAKLFTLSKNCVLNADDPAAEFMKRKKNKNYITYGLYNDCDLKAVKIENLPDGSSFEVEIDGEAEYFFLPAKGRFNIYNCLAAIGAALALNVPVDVIRKGVSEIRGIPGRIESVPNKINAHVIVDYAHSPDGLVNIINAVREFTKGRLITLFGCGGEKDKGKRSIMGRVAGELSDFCILTTDNPRSESPEEIIRQIVAGITDSNCPFAVHTDRKEAIIAGVEMLKAEDALIIAGKGHEHYQHVNGEYIPFDDVEIASGALQKRAAS